MERDLIKLFTTAQNFELLREKLGEYKRLPSEKETREFLDFFDDIYKIWKVKNPLNDLKALAEKVRIRKEFINKLGIMQ